MDADQGDDYIVAPTTGAGTGGSQYEIRVTDASGNLVNNGEVYNFSLPAACVPNGCSASYTSVSYTTSTSPGGSTPPPPPPSGTCALTSAVTNSWPGGYQLQLTVTNNGTAPLTGWTTGFMFGDTAEAIASSWSATVTQSGRQITAVNASYNGAVAAGGSTSFGMVVNGSNQTLSGLTCAPT
jgi:cellulase/cellobiase CelA1